jgi:hypothetical protein
MTASDELYKQLMAAWNMTHHYVVEAGIDKTVVLHVHRRVVGCSLASGELRSVAALMRAVAAACTEPRGEASPDAKRSHAAASLRECANLFDHSSDLNTRLANRSKDSAR